MGFLTEREPDIAGTIGDAPSFATAGFLDAADGGSGNDAGSGGGNSGEFDPAIHAGRDKRNADGSYRRKRGRKAGGSNSTSPRGRTKADNQASIDALTNILVVVHAGIATATKTPEVSIERDDAETLAKAAANVLIEFDIAPDPKVTAVIGLVMAAGTVYGPMIYNIRTRKKRAAIEHDQQSRGYQP